MLLKICQILHRIVGLLMVPLILYITITGLLILHSKDLSLDNTPARNSIILWIYGKPRIFFIGGERIEEDYPPSLEKAFVSMHGGNFFGRSAPVVLDALGLSVITLSLTGPYLWYKRIQLSKGKMSKASGKEKESD